MAEDRYARKPKLKTPPHACDTHMHAYEAKYPVAPTAPFAPPVAPISEYRKLQAQLGLERVVVVQPSAYGFDNSCTLDSMAQIGGNARGIAVVQPDVSDAELERLTKAGIRGIRYFMLKGGLLPWDTLDRMSARVKEFGWHVQMQLDGRLMADHEAQLARVSGDLVIDHNGKFLEPVPADHPGAKALMRLLDNGRTWMKVSGPYETSKTGRPKYEDVGVLAKAFISHAPDRMVWASNWPHPSKLDDLPDDVDLLDVLLDWAPDEKLRTKILADNPAKLYGF